MSKLTVIVALVLIIAALVSILIFTLRSSGIGDGPEREMILTLGWNGEEAKIPAPVEFPRWGKETWEFRQWRWKKDARKFTTFDLEGYKYVADGHGFARNDQGKLYGLFGSVKRYHPDGSLDATTLLRENNEPYQWYTYNKQGRKIIDVRITLSNKDGSKIYNVAYYDDDGKMVKEWRANKDGVVFSEQVRDLKKGNYHFTHQIKELEN